jgi:Bacterial regulatory helix-turn-helix protein, lysR family
VTAPVKRHRPARCSRMRNDAPGSAPRHLRYFIRVVEAGSFSRAATIHVAQPALSQQITELEEELGVSAARSATVIPRSYCKKP